MIHLNLGTCCPEFIQSWQYWAKQFNGPVALLPTMERAAYLDLIGPKSRNMLKKADKNGIVVKPFVYNHRLDDIYVINTSLPMRQGQRMTSAYRLPPKASTSYIQCALHRYDWIGAFHEDLLVAYCNLVVVNELGVINRLLGHGEFLKMGVMNALVAGVTEIYLKSPVKYINYRTIEGGSSGLQHFKRSVGFRSQDWQLT